MFTRLSRAAHRDGKDAGIGLIMVIGLAGVMTIMMGVLINIVVNSLDGSHRHNAFDAALSSAESGIDQTLARLTKAYVDGGGTAYYTPSNGIAGVDSSPLCSGTPIPSHEGTFASVAEERAWARQVIATAIEQNPACIQHTSNGDFVAVKTQDTAPNAVQQVVYAQGWAPSYGAANARTRLVKAEYLFQPYAPSNAILTNGNLTIEHSTLVTTADPAEASLADIHSNGDVTFASCAYQVTGQASATGAAHGSTNCGGALGGDGTVQQTPAQAVPVGTARQLYSQNAHKTAYANFWYDMCPNGDIRTPGTTDADRTVPPCDATETLVEHVNVGGVSSTGFEYEGLNADGHSADWEVVGVGNQGVASGVYYFQYGNVSPGHGLGNKSTASLTIIASAWNNASFTSSICPKQGGNITWNLDDPLTPAIQPGLFMYADADLTTMSNFSAGSQDATGLFIAGDQVHMTTSSNGAYGSVLAGDQCAATSTADENFVNNPEIYYDPDGSAPFTNIIDTTLWLEFVGD